MEKENLKYFKQLIKYSDLLATTMKSLIILMIGVIIWGIVVFWYRETGIGDLLSPLLITFLIIAPTCILFVFGTYFAIKFSIAKNKVALHDYSNLNIDNEQISNNLNKANSISTLYYIFDILGLDKTNIGTAISSLTFFSAVSLFSKNNKILKKHDGILTENERRTNNILKLSLIFITLMFSVFLNVGEIISSQKNKNDIQNNIDALNNILQSNFSDYQLHTDNFQSQISTKNFDTLGRHYYIVKDNFEINFDLNHKAQIDKFSIEITYNKLENLDEKEIISNLKSLKNKLDISFMNYYSLKEYASSDIVLTSECTKIINDKVNDTISIDTTDINKPLRYFAIHSTDENIKVSYSYSSYIDD